MTITETSANTPLPNMQAVQSTNIAAIGHDGSATYIQFHNGAVWKYRGVSPEQHDALQAAESVGKHFNAHFEGKFEAEKIQ